MISKQNNVHYRFKADFEVPPFYFQTVYDRQLVPSSLVPPHRCTIQRKKVAWQTLLLFSYEKRVKTCFRALQPDKWRDQQTDRK